MKRRQINRAVLLATLIFSFLIISSVEVYAERGWGGHQRRKNGKWKENIDKIHEELSLTDEQKATLKEHKEKHRSSMKETRQQVRAKREEFQKEIQKQVLDENRVKQLNEELKTLQNKIADQRLEGMLEIRQILTPEQYEKFDAVKQKRKRMRKGKYKGIHKGRFQEHGFDMEEPKEK